VRSLAPVLFLVSSLACIPILPAVRKAQSGRVVDDVTGQPLAGATVVLESWQVPTPPIGSERELLYTYETTTDAAGHWHAPAERDLMIGVLAPDGLPVFLDSFCVIVSGYQRFLVNPWRAEQPRGTEYRFELDWTEPPAIVRLMPRRSPPDPGAPSASLASRCGVPLEPPQ